jgi:hypothetical protein
MTTHSTKEQILSTTDGLASSRLEHPDQLHGLRRRDPVSWPEIRRVFRAYEPALRNIDSTRAEAERIRILHIADRRHES